MDAVWRAAAVYTFLYVVYRVAGKRALSDMNAFDLLVLLIISEATQQAMVSQDNSVTHAFVLITTLVGMDIVLSLIKQRSKKAERVLDSVPLLIVEDGKALRQNMEKERVDEDDVLQAARELHGISRMEEIRYAVLERNGKISVIPKEGA
jgi:uncharacterized membrane protein YcaP (DUF421 family)